MSKLSGLQNALNSSSGRVAASVAPAPLAASTPTTTRTGKPPSRAEQINISAWLHKDFKKSIRLVQAKRLDNSSLQDLMAEAFNDLFSKYNVPTVNQE
jgi:hypothetical protein